MFMINNVYYHSKGVLKIYYGCQTNIEVMNGNMDVKTANYKHEPSWSLINTKPQQSRMVKICYCSLSYP